jgi:hypothetical protein
LSLHAPNRSGYRTYPGGYLLCQRFRQSQSRRKKSRKRKKSHFQFHYRSPCRLCHLQCRRCRCQHHLKKKLSAD